MNGQTTFKSSCACCHSIKDGFGATSCSNEFSDFFGQWCIKTTEPRGYCGLYQEKGFAGELDMYDKILIDILSGDK